MLDYLDLKILRSKYSSTYYKASPSSLSPPTSKGAASLLLLLFLKEKEELGGRGWLKNYFTIVMIV